MGNLVRINQDNITFTLEEALELIPTIKGILNRHEEIIQRYLKYQRIAAQNGATKKTVDRFDTLVVEEMQAWGLILTKMGLRVSQGYIFFNTGTGWYVYLAGAETISYYLEHGKGLEHMIKVTPEALLT